LGLIFPERKSVVERHPYLPVVFYLGSLALLIPLQVFYPDPAFLRAYQPILAYVALSTVVFVASVLNAGFRAPSIVAKQRARVILVGAGLAFPLTLFTQYISLFAGDLVASLPIQINLAAVPVILFPAAVAYAMVKHNLFDIDTFVRRTCGYVLSTAAIVAAYGLLVSLLNVTVRGADISRSPAFSLVFALAIVFVFEPLHKRLQDIVDHMFYRQQYDYRKTVKEIGETMMSLLEPALIHRTLLGSVVNEMTLENGVVLTPDRAQGGGYQIQLVEGVEREALPATPLAVDEPLLQVLQEKKDLLFRHELELHPQYQAHRAVLRPVFDRFAAEVMVPVRYKEETLGIVSLGRKKSGKMFTLEDVDFLKTITNQSAMALENARLFREYLEKGRLDEELKIAHNIQMSMLPTKAPAVAGFEIAARSLPARQVGGDFYDFLEIQHNGRGSQLGVVVGDVSGKAMSAALLMAASRSVFRVLSESHFSVEEVMTRGNQRLKKDIKKGMFVALLYAVVDPTRKILTLSSAGQTQPIICRGDGSSPTYIETAGDKFPLGIVANSHYQETCISLQPHDTVVLYTDGMVEAMNEQKEMYGFERLLAAIERGRDLTASSLLDSLMNEVSHFVGNAEQHDDLTVVVLKVD
jgi:serine phosphatase RsbU (regulator of sigma subunit)